MLVSTTWHGKIVVLHVDLATVDASKSVEFKTEVLRVLEEDSDGLILDMSKVEFIDSAGLGAIVGAFKAWGKRGPFMVVGVTSAVSRIFRLTRMDKVFNIHATTEDALREYTIA